MRSLRPINQNILTKDDATEQDWEIVIHSLIDAYPAEYEDDDNPDPHTDNLPVLRRTMKVFKIVREELSRF